MFDGEDLVRQANKIRLQEYHELIKKIEALVDENPNDMDLGIKIRKLMNEYGSNNK